MTNHGSNNPCVALGLVPKKNRALGTMLKEYVRHIELLTGYPHKLTCSPWRWEKHDFSLLSIGSTIRGQNHAQLQIEFWDTELIRVQNHSWSSEPVFDKSGNQPIRVPYPVSYSGDYLNFHYSTLDRLELVGWLDMVIKSNDEHRYVDATTLLTELAAASAKSKTGN
jgi:hypothetical protein